MNRQIIFLISMFAVTGCTPEQFTRPPIPDTTPNRPAASVMTTAQEPRNRTPVTASQINDQNATLKLRELEMEIDEDARASTPQ